MKKLLFLIVALMCANAAYAARYTGYVSGKAGYESGDAQWLGDQTGFAGALAFGSNYRGAKWVNWRSELEVAYHVLSNVNLFSVMANFYGDFGTSNWRLRPYVGAGFGGGFVSVDSEPTDSSVGMGWNIRAGAIYDISDDWKLDFGVHRTWVSALDFTLTTFGAGVGARWAF
jgi:opacity protein-like surface antigen